MTTVNLGGNAVSVNGELPKVGQSAPDFKLTNGDLADVSLGDFSGKKKLLSIFPSVDTATCALSTKKFNDYAKQHADTVMLMISADLPFAQGRFCGDEGLENVHTLSMMRDKNFAKDYGVLLQDGPLAGVTARAIVVLDGDNKVLHTELVGEIGDEPDYESALAALAK
ncbi:MAG: thiol peroxidase [Gammaproteobacteria bacterium]|nr:thiol peroxidase [Gammaproteobacteria bacterium]NNC97132.1 thiol peroxidase [Gammaproteobacteria bacterium]NNM13620.1 thiol peroxidase [Gammaproteobacteria bacterium]